MSIVVQLPNQTVVTHSDANDWHLSHAGALIICHRGPRYDGILVHSPGAVTELFLYAPGEWKTARREP